MSGKWSAENVVKFAASVEEKPCLWKKSDNFYKNRFRKEAAYEELAAEMKCGVGDVKTKLKSFRTTFLQYFHKVDKSGSAGGKQATWKFYNNFVFMSEEVGQAGDVDSMSVRKSMFKNIIYFPYCV